MDYSNLPGVHPICQGWNKVLRPGCLTVPGRLRLNDVQAVRTAATPVREVQTVTLSASPLRAPARVSSVLARAGEGGTPVLTAVDTVTTHADRVGEVQLVLVSATHEGRRMGGTFALAFGPSNNATAPLAFNATAESVERALNKLPAVPGPVSVSRLRSGDARAAFGLVNDDGSAAAGAFFEARGAVTGGASAALSTSTL